MREPPRADAEPEIAPLEFVPEAPAELPMADASPLAPSAPLLPVEEFDAEDVETVNEFEQALNSLDAPLPEVDLPGEPLEIAEVMFAETREAEPIREPEVKHVRVRSNIDILAELEKLRKSATSSTTPEKPARRPAAGISIDDLLANSLNHRKEVNRIFEVQVPQRDLAASQQVVVALRIEGKDNELIGEEKTFSIDLHTRQDIEKLLLSLKFHIFGK